MAGASRRRPGAAARLAVAVALVATAAGYAATARAESAWVKDELRLNLRTGPGTEFRIVASIATGDSVEILERSEGWTKVRANGVDVGWIPAGYLQVEMPARLRLEQIENQSAKLRDQLAGLESEADRLREENQSLAGEDSSQKREIAELTQENVELRAGARWPDRVAGAAILGAGMLLGAILQRRAGRRQGPRIKL